MLAKLKLVDSPQVVLRSFSALSNMWSAEKKNKLRPSEFQEAEMALTGNIQKPGNAKWRSALIVRLGNIIIKF